MSCLKIVPKGNLSETMSNWQTSIGYEDNQIMASDSKTAFHTNPKCGVRSALPYSVEILLSFGIVIHSTLAMRLLSGSCDLGHRV